MTPENFIQSYETALAAQNWSTIDPLVAEGASVTFSDGTVHYGKDKVKAAFEQNFTIIKSEKYAIKQVKWLRKEANYAAYLFEFEWSGLINGNLVSGDGIGTSVLIKEKGQWKLLTEHLGKKPVVS